PGAGAARPDRRRSGCGRGRRVAAAAPPLAPVRPLVIHGPYGTVTPAPCFGSAVAPRLKPEKVAEGAPEMVAFDGEAEVMRHSPRTMVLNDQSVPSCSCSVTSNRLPESASWVSCAATGPIAFTVSEKVID